MTLTDRTTRSLKPRATGQYERYDDVVPGLWLRVNSGSKSWVLFYRERLPDTSGGFTSGKRKKRWTLGTYPALSLSEARAKAQRALHALTTQGIDLAVGKREARRDQSFGELAADYLERHAKPQKKSWREDQRQLTGISILPSRNTPMLHPRAGCSRVSNRRPSSPLHPRAVTRPGLESTGNGSVPPHFSDTSPR